MPILGINPLRIFSREQHPERMTSKPKTRLPLPSNRVNENAILDRRVTSILAHEKSSAEHAPIFRRAWKAFCSIFPWTDASHNQKTLDDLPILLQYFKNSQWDNVIELLRGHSTLTNEERYMLGRAYQQKGFKGAFTFEYSTYYKDESSRSFAELSQEANKKQKIIHEKWIKEQMAEGVQRQ